MRVAICLVVLAGSLVWGSPATRPVQAASACRAVAGYSLTLPGRVDDILASGTSGRVLVLVGRAGSSLPYIPHDSLTIVGADGHTARSQPAALPPYVMPPGLAAVPGGGRVYMLADSLILTVDSLSGRTLAWQDLGLQAIGAPAAISTASGGDVFLIGQPADAYEAQAYGYRPDSHGRLQERWRTPLGPTHAGSWIGIAAGGLVAVFGPDQHDQHGTIALLSQADGTLRGSYQLLMPPAAADAGRDRLYLAGAGKIYAVQLGTGRVVTTVDGEAPLAANPATGLVAFPRDGRIEVARSEDLHDVFSVAIPGGMTPTALAWSGSTLLVGSTHGLSRILLDGCRA
jgi:hypothetical protein